MAQFGIGAAALIPLYSYGRWQGLASVEWHQPHHFTAEEKLFQKYAYPKYPDQKREHDKLTAQVLELKKKADSGASVITMEVMNFLKDWLSSHIMGADKMGGEYLNSKGVS